MGRSWPEVEKKGVRRPCVNSAHHGRETLAMFPSAPEIEVRDVLHVLGRGRVAEDEILGVIAVLMKHLLATRQSMSMIDSHQTSCSFTR